MSANPIVHWELMSPDGDALRDFYAGLFDWNFQGAEGFDKYYMVDAEQTVVGGAVGEGNENMPNYSVFYVQVEDIDAHLGKINANGGSTVVPRTVIPEMVTFALFNDPAGNMVGLVEAATPGAE